ncbi:MAG: RNA polymerase sigma factor [Gemmatimonadaceae bacterium]
MRGGDSLAWSLFLKRFRPPLERYARQIRIPSEDWPECIDEVLEEVAMRLIRVGAIYPERLDAHLFASARRKFQMVERGQRRRSMRHLAALDSATRGDAKEEGVLRVLCSESARRNADGETSSEGAVSHPTPLTRLVDALRLAVPPPDRPLFQWLGQRVPYREIAGFLGISYDAAAKRISRLTARLRLATPAIMATLPEDEQRELTRLFTRGHVPETRALRVAERAQQPYRSASAGVTRAHTDSQDATHE